MPRQLISFTKFLVLVLLLNIIRYVFGAPFERLLIFERQLAAME